MATQTDNTAHAAPVSTLLAGSLWASICLGIFGWWMWLLRDDLAVGAPFYIVTWLLCVASLGFFVFTTVQWFKERMDSAKLAALGARLRPLLSIACLAAGVVLLALALWLCLAESERLKYFAEITSLAVMGLVCVIAGLALRHSGQPFFSRQAVLQSLLEVRQPLAMVFIALGVISAGVGIYLFFNARGEFSKFPGGPEGIGLFLLGLAWLGGGLWTQLTLDKPANEDTMRLSVLYIGSVTGLVLSVFALVRFIAWWGQISGGLSALKSAEGWRFWLCEYVGLLGLAILFGSLLLARVDIRSNVGMRRLLYGYNAFLTGFLLLELLIVANVIVWEKAPANIEWTPNMGLYSLSGASRNILETLPDKVTVHVLIGRYGPSYMEVRDLMDNCLSAAKPGKLAVEYVSPDLDDKQYRELAQTYPELGKQSRPGFGGGDSRGLLIVYGESSLEKTPPHTFVPSKDLEESAGFMPGGGSPKTAFKGEEVVMQSIQQLANLQKKVKVYFTQYGGEIWLNDLDFQGRVGDNRFRSTTFSGAGSLAAKLRKSNFEVWGLVWDEIPRVLQTENIVSARSGAAPKDEKSKEKDEKAKDAPADLKFKTDVAKGSQESKSKPEVPADCDVLVIANPGEPLDKDELEAIERYMDRKESADGKVRPGKLMILSRTPLLKSGHVVDDGVAELCKRINVEVGNDLVLKSPRRNQQEEVLLVVARVPNKVDNKAALPFKGKNIHMFMPRTVRPGKGTSSFQAETILEVSEAVNRSPIWVETSGFTEFTQSPLHYWALLKELRRFEEKVSSEPVSVGVAVTDNNNVARAMVIGDYSFITSDMFESFPAETAQFEFFRSSLEWLAQTKVQMLGIPAKVTSSYSVSSDFSDRFWRTVLLPLGLIMLALAGTGAGVWVVRRR